MIRMENESVDSRSSLRPLKESVEDKSMVINPHDESLASRANQDIRHLLAASNSASQPGTFKENEDVPVWGPVGLRRG
jgi:hypothetical protein